MTVPVVGGNQFTVPSAESDTAHWRCRFSVSPVIPDPHTASTRVLPPTRYTVHRNPCVGVGVGPNLVSGVIEGFRTFFMPHLAFRAILAVTVARLMLCDYCRMPLLVEVVLCGYLLNTLSSIPDYWGLKVANEGCTMYSSCCTVICPVPKGLEKITGC